MGNRSGYKAIPKNKSLGISKTVEKLTSPKLSIRFWFYICLIRTHFKQCSGQYILSKWNNFRDLRAIAPSYIFEIISFTLWAIKNPVKHLRWKIFAKLVDDLEHWAIFIKTTILFVWLGSERASVFCRNTLEKFENERLWSLFPTFYLKSSYFLLDFG